MTITYMKENEINKYGLYECTRCMCASVEDLTGNCRKLIFLVDQDEGSHVQIDQTWPNSMLDIMNAYPMWLTINGPTININTVVGSTN